MTQLYPGDRLTFAAIEVEFRLAPTSLRVAVAFRELATAI
jgi:hypothetical protein